MHCTTHLIPISQGQTSNAQLFFSSSFPASALVSRLVFSLFGSISNLGQTLYETCSLRHQNSPQLVVMKRLMEQCRRSFLGLLRCISAGELRFVCSCFCKEMKRFDWRIAIRSKHEAVWNKDNETTICWNTASVFRYLSVRVSKRWRPPLIVTSFL